MNPHLSLTCDWDGERLLNVKATDTAWKKWGPSDPTSPHWYAAEHFQRLVSAHLAHSDSKTVRELVAEFRGLTSTAKQKRVLAATGLHREPLSALVNGDGKSLDGDRLATLLRAMQSESKPVKPAGLGIIGKDHIAGQVQGDRLRDGIVPIQESPLASRTRFRGLSKPHSDGVPKPTAGESSPGANWSPGIVNPFRELGQWGQSLDTVLAQQRATSDEPVVLLLHLACPRVQFADRGKSTVVVE